MRWIRVILAGTMLALLAAFLFWLGQRPAGDVGLKQAAAGIPGPEKTIRLGLIPERDIFAQREAYRGFCEWVGRRMGAKVELVTNASYEGVLEDFASKNIDAAFLGSLVAVLAMDRQGAEVLTKSESIDGRSTYAGVVFVPESSPIKSFAELQGHTLGAVKTTTAGPLFGVYIMSTLHGMVSDQVSPRFVWLGTHDDVMREVTAGRVEAGAAKDLRLDAYEKRHPELAKFRRLASSQRVPDNALVVRAGWESKEALREALLHMQDDAAGRQALSALGLGRYVPCAPKEYEPIYEMIAAIGPQWREVGIKGPPPERKGASSRPAKGGEK